MAALREAGLVETRRGRGGGTVVTLKPKTPSARAAARISQRKRRDWLDALEYRRIVEPGAAHLAAQQRARRRPPRAARAGARPRSRRARRPADHRQADSRFHLTVAALTDSPRVIEAVTRVQAHPARDAARHPRARRQHRPLRPPARRPGPRHPGPASRTGRGGSWRNTATTPPRCCAASWADRTRPSGERMATRNDRHLTMAELVGPDRRRRHRHGRGRLHRHAGPAAGQAPARAVLRRPRGRRTATEGCNYLLAVDVDMNTVDGYAISSWDKGYGDMEFVLDHDTIRVLTHLPATAMVQCDLVWPDHCPGRPVAPRDPAAAARPGRRARLDGPGRHRAGVHRVRHAVRGGAPQRLPRPDARPTSTTSTTRSSAPPGSSRCCATSATTCTPPGWTSRAPRASATSASTRSASCTPRR